MIDRDKRSRLFVYSFNTGEKKFMTLISGVIVMKHLAKYFMLWDDTLECLTLAKFLYLTLSESEACIIKHYKFVTYRNWRNFGQG
jgi:hypothetical protein